MIEDKYKEGEGDSINNLENKNQFKRSIAQLVPSILILNGEYEKQEDWNPNYIKFNNIKIYRVNMIGTIVDKNEVPYPSLVIDDGFATIRVRSFESPDLFDDLKIGDVALIIGKPREFAEEKYILCENIKKLENQKWIEYRKKLFNIKFRRELEEIKSKEQKEQNKNINKEEEIEEINKIKKEEEKGEAEEEILYSDEKKPEEIKMNFDDEKEGNELYEETDETNETNKKHPTTIIIETIQKLDKGDGASIEDLERSTNIKDIDEIIKKLIREGEIYKCSADRVKLL